jgi:hypothetical protein
MKMAELPDYCPGCNCYRTFKAKEMEIPWLLGSLSTRPGEEPSRIVSEMMVCACCGFEMLTDRQINLALKAVKRALRKI